MCKCRRNAVGSVSTHLEVLWFTLIRSQRINVNVWSHFHERCAQQDVSKLPVKNLEFFLKRKGSITSGDSCYNVKDEGHVTEKDIQAGTTANRLPNWLCLHSYCINHISLVSEVPEKQPKDVSVRNVTLALHFVAVAPEYYHVCWLCLLE